MNARLLISCLLMNTAIAWLLNEPPLSGRLPSNLSLLYGVEYGRDADDDVYIHEEREVYISKRTFGPGLTDDDEASTGELRARMSKKAVQLFGTLVKTNRPRASRPSPGQGGFVKMFDDATQTETARLVTCKHLWSVPGFTLAFCNVLCYSTLEYNLMTGPEFDLCKTARPGPFNLRDDILWEDGLDVAIAKSSILEAEQAPQEPAIFEFVRPDFEYEVGQRVGMVVGTSFLQLSDFTARSPGEETDFLESVYGKMDGNTHLYTGAITRVEEEHIEYNINTLPGFSGALIFLLDKKQPSTVQETDYGKVIAVHVGSPKKLRAQANVGFRCCVNGKTIIP